MDAVEILRAFASRLQSNGSITPTNEEIATALREVIEEAEAAYDELQLRLEFERYDV